jgi:hypothetical protein
MSEGKSELKNMRVYMDENLHYALKIYAATKKLTMQDVIAEALKAYIPEELWKEDK